MASKSTIHSKISKTLKEGIGPPVGWNILSSSSAEPDPFYRACQKAKTLEMSLNDKSYCDALQC